MMDITYKGFWAAFLEGIARSSSLSARTTRIQVQAPGVRFGSEMPSMNTLLSSYRHAPVSLSRSAPDEKLHVSN
jgi:hypothetical protein